MTDRLVPVGLDFETHLVPPTSFSPPPPVCLGLAALKGTHPLAEYIDDADLRDGTHALLHSAGAFDRYLISGDAARVIWPALLRDERLEFIIHNSPFDLQVGAEASGDIESAFIALDQARIRDTFLRARLIAIAEGEVKFRRDPLSGKMAPPTFSLASEVARYFGVDLSADKAGPDIWRTRYSELDGVPLRDWPAAAVAYAQDDPVWHFKVALAQEETYPALLGDIVPPGLDTPGWPTRDRKQTLTHIPWIASELRETQAAFALNLGSTWGWRTDKPRVAELLANWRAAAAEGEALGRGTGTDDPEAWVRTAVYLRGPKKGQPTKRDGTVDKKVLQGLVEADCAARGVDPVRTEKGAISVKKDVLLSCQNEKLRAYGETMQRTRFLSVYGPILLQGLETPITPKVTTTLETGRVALAKPPMQQPPRDGGFRECFVPRPGFLFASADYDQIELRTLGQIHIWWGLGDSLARAFWAGIDPHAQMAAAILDAEGHSIPEADQWTYAVVSECLAGLHGPKWRTVAKKYRQMAKAANFGFPGGLGADTFIAFAAGYGVSLTRDEAVGLKKTYLATWPEMEGYFAKINEYLGYGDSFVLRQAVSGRLRGDCGYCDGANSYFQGLAADGFKTAHYRIQREMKVDPTSPMYGGCVVGPMHDEAIAEVPVATAAAAAERLAYLMAEAMQEHLPDMPILAQPHKSLAQAVQPVLMERWAKDADTVRDSDGVLQVWKPGKEGT